MDDHELHLGQLLFKDGNGSLRKASGFSILCEAREEEQYVQHYGTDHVDKHKLCGIIARL